MRDQAKEKMDIRIRKASMDDIDVMVDLRSRQLSDEGQVPNPYMAQNLRQYFEEKMAGDELVEYLGEVDGKVIACAAVIIMDYPPSYANPSGKTGYIANVYTADAFRGQGIAGKLLDKVEQEARQRGISRALLNASDMGIRAYKKSGYKKTDTVMEKDI